MTKKTRPRPPSSPASVSRSRPTSITTTTKSTSPRPASITTTSSFKAQNPGLQWKSLLLPGDKFMQIVKLEGEYLDHVRYLCIVSHNEEFFLLGVDEDNEDSRSQPTIGLVCKMIHGMKVTLDGDGGFTYHHHLDKHRQLIFKPVSVQALWTVIQTLHEIGKRLQPMNTNPEQSEDWINQYKINSPQSCVNEWHTMADVLVRRPPSPHRTPRIQRITRSEINADFQIVIKNRLRQIMKSSNLDTITSKRIRAQLESDLGQNLEEHKSFIDTEILQILGQMDPASKILDYLYLGSEWNAGNLEELHANGITHILNVTREIDNFFPADFKYKNIRVYDEESTNLRKYFDDSYRFIKDAKDQNGKVLVHCKMGISRSASCTIAYIMKEYGNELTSAMQHAKDRRSIVNPNKSFKKQLEVYDGMLSAFRQRTNYQRRLFRSKSEHAISIESSTDHDDLHGITKDIDIKKIIPNFLDQHGHHGIITDRPTTSSSSALLSPLSSHQGIGHVRHLHRPKSWSPNDQVTHFLLDQADRISKSATADNVVDDCSHIYNISELMPSSPVNAVNNVIDPNCDCNVELELSVPAEPVSVSRQNDSGDVETDLIVQRLSQLPIQMRTSNSLLDDIRTSSTPGGSVASSVSSTTSVPTTPIFALKRRGSVDSTVWSSKPPPNPPPMPPPAPPAPQSSHLPTINSEVLSVKTLANMFDFKVSPIPLRPCSARLEDNHIFQRMAKQLDNNTDNSGSTFVANLSQSNPL